MAVILATTVAAATLLVSPSADGHGLRVRDNPKNLRTQSDAVPTPSTPLAPTEYVREALDFIAATAFRLGGIDWRAIRLEAEAKARLAPSTEDAYEVIVDTLKAINDKHSSFTRPPQAELQTTGSYNGYGFVAVWPSKIVVTVANGSPSAKAGLRTGDRIAKIDGKPPLHNETNIVVPRDRKGDFPPAIVVSVLRKGLRNTRNIPIVLGSVTLVSVPTASVVVPPKIGGAVGAFGYIDVPGIIGDGAAQKQYAQTLQDAIRSTDTTPRCGWVVDLRRNRGGYIYAMLNGLGPLLGSGPVAGQLNASGTRTMWSYIDGTLFSGDTATVVIDQPYRIVNANAAIAVLTSGLTASAGEATTIAFRTRATTRSFGERTTGLTTFNVRKRMPDGAFLDILNAVDIDRNGTIYDGPVPPDQFVGIDWTNIGNQKDPVLTAATRWLGEQPSCKQS